MAAAMLQSDAWSRFFGVAILLLACCASADGSSAFFQRIEPFDDALISEHLYVIIGVSVAASLAVLAAVLLTLTGKRLYLSVVIAIAMWVMVMAVSISVWGQTYSEVKEVIQDDASKLLEMTGTTMVQNINVELSKGIIMAEHFALQVRRGQNLFYRDLYPTAHDFVYGFVNATNAQTVFQMYYGLDNGQMIGVTNRDGAVRLFAGTTPDSVLPAEVKCDPQYDEHRSTLDCEQYANVTDGCDGSNAALEAACALSCSHPAETKFCLPRRAVGNEKQNTSTVMMYASYDRETGFTYLADKEHPPPNEGNYGTRVTKYDPRVRPWYRHTHIIQWSDPYVFYSTPIAAGMTMSRGLFGPDGAPVGVLGVDYTWGSIGNALKTLPPTKNSLIFIVSMNMVVVASSFTPEQFEADTGLSLLSLTSVQDIVTAQSRIRKASLAIEERFNGSLENAMNGSSLLQEDGSVIASFPMDIEGLQVLGVIELPHSDLMGTADRVSTRALGTAVGMSSFVSVLFFLVIVAMLRPLGKLAKDMEEVAWMNLDDIADRGQAAAQEIAWMQRSFHRMVSNLREYRQYLPQSILDGDEGDDGSSVSDTVVVKAAIVFTDIAASTACWEASTEGMRKGLKLHNVIFRALIAEYRGHEVKTIGDAFMVAFPDPYAAVNFAVEAQERLHAAEWPEELLTVPQAARTEDGSFAGLRVRIGVNYGDVDSENNCGKRDYFGPVVNKAARLEGCCIPGSVAVTEEVLVAVGDPEKLRPCVRIPMGNIPLRGITEEPFVSLLLPEPLLMRKVLIEDMAREKMKDARKTRNGPPAARSRTGEELWRADVGGQSEVGKSHGSAGATTVAFMENRTKDKFKEQLSRAHTATVGCIDARHAESLVEDFHDPMHRVSHVTSLVLSAVMRTGGKTITLVGSLTLSGWNITRSCGSHARSSAKCVGLLHSNLGEGSGICLSTGLVTYTVLHGNVGGGKQKFVNVYGPGVPFSMQLSSAALHLGATCLYANLFGEDPPMRSVHQIRPVDEVHLAGMERKAAVFEVRPDGAMENPLQGFTTTLVDETPPWPWSTAYADAFERGDAACIRENASSDPTLMLVAMHLEGKTHPVSSPHPLEVN